MADYIEYMTPETAEEINSLLKQARELESQSKELRKQAKEIGK
jgi:septal ring factor EnvC (AmiA/AmiB activator)